MSLSTRIRTATLGALVLVALAVAAAPASAAQPGAGWTLESFAQPTNFAPGSNNGTYTVTATKLGAGATDESEIKLTDTVPPGLTVTSLEFYWSVIGTQNDLSGFFCDPVAVSCTKPAGIFGLTTPAGGFVQMVVHVAVDPGASGSITNSAEVTGGGGPAASTSETNTISPDEAPFGVTQLRATITGADGRPETQAGAHPYSLRTKLFLANKFGVPAGDSEAGVVHQTVEDVRTFVVDLPLGFLGSAVATPKCKQADLVAVDGGNPSAVGGCAAATVVGHLLTGPTGNTGVNSDLYNMVPAKGYVAAFGFQDLVHGTHLLYAKIVPTPEGYVLRTVSPDVPQGALTDVAAEFYGVPARRTNSGVAPLPMFTNPTDCSAGPLTMTAYADSWLHPARKLADGSPDLSDPNWKTTSTTLPEVTGCNKLKFDSTLQLRPETTVANSPTGLDVSIKVPQSEDADTLSTPPLKKAVVTLPPGLTVNPGSAEGLGACSPAQIGLGSALSPSCPENSKIGTLELETPLLAQTVKGSIYLATQNDNPFNTLLAAYLVVDDADTGIVVKIPGKLDADPQTGQITGTFDNNPQFPFSELRLHFKGGPRGVLATPEQCGTLTATSVLTPWSAPDSGPDSTPSDSFGFPSGCQGGFDPSLTAGTKNPQAGAYSPFVLSFQRADTDEQFAGLKVTLPDGLLAKVAGVGQCSDAQLAQAAQNSGAVEQASSSCPADSQVGTVTTGAGVGARPLFVPGKAYLTGPYKGAPYGLAVVVPALAGPFDLGTVVIRQALDIDPTDAHVTATSDPFPIILQGIPLRIRRVDLSLDRPGFILNPTSCDPSQITGTLSSLAGTQAPVASRFQVGGCRDLAFAPRLALRATGKRQTKTNGHPGIRAAVTQAKGQAAIEKAVVRLPKALALDPDNAGALCEYVDGTKPDLENRCPKGSIVGRARARTPLLDRDLTGNVYFVKNVRVDPKTGNQIRTLPMIVVALRGEIDINLVGKSSVKGGRLVNTFAGVPDAPISRFDLNIAGGDNGILVVTNSAKGPLSLCRGRQNASVRMGGQNGKVRSFTTALKAPCAKKRAARKGR